MKTRLARRLKSPAVQFVAAVGGMVGGAWLIAMWAVGVVVVAASLAVAVDAMLRDGAGGDVGGRQAMLERYWHAR